MIVRVLSAMVLSSILAGAAVADDRCAVPLADWQPRTALQHKLESEGWTILRIRSDDGCYKVLARDATGRPVKARFDPGTLERVPGGHDRRDHDREDDGD